MNWTKQIKIVWSIAFIGTATIIGLGWQTGPYGLSASVPRGSPSAPRDVSKSLANRAVHDNFEASLKAREAADFLLTPAILVQECVTEGAVITYPTE